MTCFGVIGAGM